MFLHLSVHGREHVWWQDMHGGEWGGAYVGGMYGGGGGVKIPVIKRAERILEWCSCFTY